MAKLEDYPILIEEESGEPESEKLPRYGYKTHAFGEESVDGGGVYVLRSVCQMFILQNGVPHRKTILQNK